MHRAAHWFLVLALSFSMGLHWVLLQSAAWMGMVVTYSQDTTLLQGVAMTFDGEHPCRWCRSVEQGAASHKQQEVRFSVTKVEFLVPETVTFTSDPAVTGLVTRFPTLSQGALRLTPPTPPPERIA